MTNHAATAQPFPKPQIRNFTGAMLFGHLLRSSFAAFAIRRKFVEIAQLV
jgi:hypothetical protein